ncbi:actin-related protein 2/3 complex subunit 1A-like [Oscarella lobularis]|uniref:actin-related protein 2/3 complex subunit 1A-like n=1 Tax=Oscarella lobularis TaxID=121494 RepID=UPI0033133D49
MSGKEVHELILGPITCHAWNADRTQLAISPNNNDVHIYKLAAGKWTRTHVLKEHGSRVTGVDWGTKTNRLVTCGADRNAYVWTYDQKANKWEPVLVILRINRAATCVKWSPEENKFAVGSGARLISICYFEDDQNWWVSKHIKKPIRSTVLSVDWHPNNILVAAGCADFKTRVFSAYVKEVEGKPSATVWGKKMTFGNLMSEFSNGGGGWVHGVSFSASGNKLAWVGHDSSVSVADASQEMAVATLKCVFRPFLCCLWLTENSLVVAGHDCWPALVNHSDQGKLTFVEKLDTESSKKAAGAISAMDKFRTLDQKATTEAVKTSINFVHQNTITNITVHSRTGSEISKFTTTGVDGRLVNWSVKSLESAIAGLKIH